MIGVEGSRTSFGHHSPCTKYHSVSWTAGLSEKRNNPEGLKVTFAEGEVEATLPSFFPEHHIRNRVVSVWNRFRIDGVDVSRPGLPCHSDEAFFVR